MPYTDKNQALAPEDVETYNTTYKCDVPFDAPFAIEKAYVAPAEEGEEEELWYIEGRAVIDKLDYQHDVVSPIAMKNALPDLDINSTILYNHDGNIEIGAIDSYKFLGDSIWVRGVISKTRANIWTRIKEGTLRKFSMRGSVLAFDLRYVPEIGVLIRYIKAMTINEISVVTVSGQGEASFNWYVKNDEPMAYHIKKAFTSNLEGGDLIMKKARKSTSFFKVEKKDSGEQVLTIQLPEGFEKAEDVDDLDLGELEKAIKDANTNIDSILKAVGEVPEDANDAVKALFGKIQEAATALKDGSLSDEQQKVTTTVKKSDNEQGNVVQIVLPSLTLETQKTLDDADADTDKDPAQITKSDLADPVFQEAMLQHMQKGLSVDESVKQAKEDVTKAQKVTSDTDSSDIVKTLMSHLVQKDQGMQTVNTAIVKLGEVVGSFASELTSLKESVGKIPLRKGLALDDEQVEAEKTKIEKSLEGKEPREQLATLLSYVADLNQSAT